MTIPDETLARPAYRHVRCPAGGTVGDAIAALRAAGGEAWLPIVIDFGGGRYGLTQVQSLARRAGLISAGLPYRAPPIEAQLDTLAQDDTPLAEIAPDAVLDTVEQDSISEEDALTRAARSPGRALAVTRGGELAGILVVRRTRHGFRRANE
ncbi:MAG: hypothetical protein JXB47_08690 [Anaerolineae bacterium]|nr:hypothetical protein [Anaerolineae bacterium]